MIVSNDQKSIYLANPKTGSRTAEELLKDYGIIAGQHLTATETMAKIKPQLPDFDYKTVENIYVFWRDPIDRFISGINFLRANRPWMILQKNPEWFTNFDYSNLITITNTGTQRFNSAGISDELKNAVKAITPEQLFNAEINSKENDPSSAYMVMEKQSRWIWPGLNILNYSNFDTNMRTVMNSFGVPSSTQIPRNNVSEKLTTSLSSELEARVREYYAEDYALQPVS